jgi:hypothetical protein
MISVASPAPRYKEPACTAALLICVTRHNARPRTCVVIPHAVRRIMCTRESALAVY